MREMCLFSQGSNTYRLQQCFSPAAGTFRGVCKKIDHFPEDADYEADAAEYLLRKSVACTSMKCVLVQIVC